MPDEPVRCDLCRLRAQADPRTIADVFALLAPPVELIDAIGAWEEKNAAKVPQSLKDYRRRWMALRRGDPIPAVDKFDSKDHHVKPAQPELLKGPTQYGR